MRAIYEAQREIQPRSTAITRDGLEELVEMLAHAGSIRAIPLESLAEERRAVFAGGLAVLVEIFEQLGIREMRVADGAMREGVLYDLMGRFTSVDARERTVSSMQKRYQVDLAQVARVEATAVMLLRQLRDRWQLEDPLAEQALRWAARLHEIGLDVAHSGYHRHGAYLLQNADMPGFSREEQLLLSSLVRSHRRKLVLDGLEDLIPPWDRLAVRLILILRLAVLLHRNRADDNLPPLRVTPRGRGLQIRFRLRSLRNHPLTAADLQQEIDHLKPEGIPLRVLTAR